MSRASHHLTVLALVAVITAGGVGSQGGPEAIRTGGAMPSVMVAAGRLVAPGLAPGAAAPTLGGADVQQEASSAAASASPPPTQPRPRWVQNYRPTEVFAGPEPDAVSLGQAPQFTTFQLLEPGERAPLAALTARTRLLEPGRGFGRLPSQVWASLDDFGPSGPPQPEFELVSSPMLATLSRRPAPERVAESWPPIPSAELAVILDGDSGTILYGKNAHARSAPASLTKIMSAILAIERAKPQDRVRVDVDSRSMWDSTVMGLTPGDVVSLETLLYGLMLPSGNDAALAIARHVAGSEAAFVDLMNARVRALGLEDTQFRNPHGLDADGHYSSPYDLAVMARQGMQDPLFASVAATRYWQAEGYSLYNLNRLLGQYPGADGVKVGFTDNAGRCIVASATRDGHRVFVTLMRSNDPIGESRALLDYTFQSFRW